MTHSRQQLEVLEALHDNVSIHARQSDGLLTVREFDPAKLEPYQSLQHPPQLIPSVNTENRRARGRKINPDLLTLTAGLIDTRYKSLEPNPQELSRTAISLDIMGEFLGNGQNVTMYMPHREFRDLAFGLGYISTALQKKGVDHRTGIVLSKGVDFLRLDTAQLGFPDETVDSFLQGIGLQADEDRTVSMRDFLGIVADYTYFTIPTTQSFKDTREKHRRLVSGYNRSVTAIIERDLRATDTKTDSESHKSGMLLAVAPTGTTEKNLDTAKYNQSRDIGDIFDSTPKLPPNLDTEARYRVIGNIGKGTLRLAGNSVIMCAGLELSPDVSRIDIDPRHIVPTTDGARERVENVFRTVLGQLFPLETFIIDHKGNLPVQRTTTTEPS